LGAVQSVPLEVLPPGGVTVPPEPESPPPPPPQAVSPSSKESAAAGSALENEYCANIEDPSFVVYDA
jgi:hypothetical protein